MDEQKQNEFAREGGRKQQGLFGEFIGFLKENRKFWLIPLVVVLLLLGVLIILGATAAAPFIYTLF